MEDFNQVLGRMQEAQTKMQVMQQKLAQIQATREAGAGAVRATVNGSKLVLRLNIDKEYINPDEKEMLQDLIIAAVNLASEAVEDKVQEEVKQQTTSALGGLPFSLS